MNRLNFTLRDPSTNWKYLLIVVLLAFIAGGGIFYYQYRWLPQKEIKLPEIQKVTKPLPEEKFVEVPLDDLKEGENKIGSVIIEKVKPELLCNAENPKESETKLINFVYSGIQKEGGYYELTCSIDTQAKVKMIGWNPGYEKLSLNVFSFSVVDMNGNLIDKHGESEYDPMLLFYEDKGKVEILHRNDKVYFLVHGGTYGMKTGGSAYFLYVVDRKGNIKTISTWGCDIYAESCNLEYVLGYQKNLFFKVGEEIWEIDENDVLKDKFPANKIIIKDSEISFQ